MITSHEQEISLAKTSTDTLKSGLMERLHNTEEALKKA